MDPEALKIFKERLSVEPVLRKLGIAYDIRNEDAVFLCPFHDEKTPSFGMNTGNGMFHCFGCGKSGGDVIGFVMELKRVGFVQALELLSDLLDIPVPKGVDEIDKLSLIRRKLVSMRRGYVSDRNLANYGDVYAHLISQCSEASGADYLRSRGIVTPEGTAGRFRTVVVDDYDRIGAAMLEKFDDRRLVESGVMNDRRNLIFFNHRLLFPFFDRDEVVYVSARTMDNLVKPKYLNLRGVVIPTFYNVNDAYESDFVFLAEGLTDTLSVAALGIPAVGIAGATNIDVESLLLLSDKDVVLGMDNDDAGRSAREKLAGMLGMVASSVSVYDKPEKDMNEHLQTEAGREKLMEFCVRIREKSGMSV